MLDTILITLLIVAICIVLLGVKVVFPLMNWKKP